MVATAAAARVRQPDTPPPSSRSDTAAAAARRLLSDVRMVMKREAFQLSQVPIYVDAARVRDLVKEAVWRMGPHATPSPALRTASTLVSLVTMALLAAEAEHEMQRLREAELAIDLLRKDVYDLFTSGALEPARFDDIARAIGVCRRELYARIAETRRRAWARLCGIHPLAHAASASSSRGRSETNSSSSKSERSLDASMPLHGA